MENRHRILDAAARIYGEVGFRGATTRRIATEAGVNEVTLFRIFGSKEALLLEALRCCGPSADVRPELPEQPQDPERELLAWATGHLAHLERNASLIRTMLGEFDERPEVGDALCEGPRCTTADVAGYLGRLRRDGFIDSDVSPRVAAMMLLGTLFSDAMGRAVMPDVYTLSGPAAAREYVRVFLRGLGYRSRRKSGTRAGVPRPPSKRGPARARQRTQQAKSSKRGKS